MPDPAGYFNRRESDVDLIDAEAGGIAVTVTRVWPAGRVPAAAAVATWRQRRSPDRRLNL
ncbi:hypothetical protein [Sodalis praecaptivus]|uniref:hypothetical protein n=1 Tax=Sodalis TaxID=84565 RepID=UPI0004B7F69D|nr:hypothetical protein [Sodalis praecaptivus]